MLKTPSILLPAALLSAVVGLIACGPVNDTPDTDTPDTESQGPSPPDFYLGGIQVHEADPDAWFEALKAQGMNLVQVTDYARQGDWDSDDLAWNDEAPRVLEEIRGAKRHGLHVLLVLRVALDPSLERNAFLWHGMIRPGTEELTASWFEKYTRFCKKWAEIAEAEGVDLLMIGSEMNALASTLPVEELPGLEEYYLNEEKQKRRREEVLAQRELIESTELHLEDSETFDSVEEYLEARIAVEREWAKQLAAGADSEGVAAVNARRAELQAHWVELIRELRGVYSGLLGYAANFDQYQEVGFWPHLDVMGINAYFKLRTELLEGVDGAERNERLYPLLVAGWTDALGGIADFRQAQGLREMPVIFTEMGYTYRRHSTLKPWSDTGFSVVYLQGEGGGEPREHVLVWRDQPDDYAERALAVRALHAAHARLEDPFLKGISYWKLSSHDYHKDVESFLVHVGEGSEDPILPELRRFLEPAKGPSGG